MAVPGRARGRGGGCWGRARRSGPRAAPPQPTFSDRPFMAGSIPTKGEPVQGALDVAKGTRLRKSARASCAHGVGPMTAFDGYRLPEELVALREQVRRFVRDEIIPVEQRIAPDAAELPDQEYPRPLGKTKSGGAPVLVAPRE